MKSSLYEYYKQKYKVGGKTPTRKTGMWYQNGDVVVPSNQITMKGPNGESDYFKSPIMGVGMQSGQTQVMQPGEEYLFPQDEAVYETMMQEGGVRTSLNNISPQGDVSYSASANVGPFNFRGDSSTNILTGKQQLISPTISADFGGLGLTATSDMFSANYSGDKGYASLNRDRKNKTTDVSAGFNAGKFNLDANAFLDKDKLMNAGASARYQVTPNLAFTGDINYSPEEGNPNYNIGFKYGKTFQEGGERSTEQNPVKMDPVNIKAPERSWFDKHITRPLRKFGRSYAKKISNQTGGSEWYKKPNSVASAFFSTGPGFVAEAPQLAATYAATGKVQTPSEAMNIENPYGAFAVDAVLDPTNLVGAGVAKKLGSGSLKNMVKSSPKGFVKNAKEQELYSAVTKDLLKNSDSPLKLEAPQNYYRATAREKLSNLSTPVNLEKQDWDKPEGLAFFGTNLDKAKEYFDPAWTRSDDNVIIQSYMDYKKPYRVERNELWTNKRIKDLKNQGYDMIYVDPKQRRNVREAAEIIPLDKTIIKDTEFVPGYMQMGGMSIPGVNGTVVAAPMSLKEVYKKKKKK